MRSSMAWAGALFLAAALLAQQALAQRSATVSGVVINIGLVSALEAEHVDAQHGVHKGGHGSGAEHIIVSLADAKSGARIGDAAVVVEVRDPRGKVQRKPLMGMITSGVPDYSEVFDFGWSGNYTVRVNVTPKGATRPIGARFTVGHSI